MDLAASAIVATIPVTNLERSLAFYRDVLGLAVVDQNPNAIRLQASNTQLSIFKRPPVERGHTMAHFEVADIEAVMTNLRSRGVAFEEYASGPIATTNGIANYAPGIRGAWFKDPDGNVLGLREGPQFGGWIK
jgi:catechol 2,3-dioxygenase-like lactoylglutathione lyase family enzyme